MHSTDENGGASRHGWNEARLVFLAAARHTDDAMRETLSAGVDWDAAGFIAARENASILLARRLGEVAPDAAPAAFRTALQRRALVSEFKQATLSARLDAALTVLTGAGVEVLLLKGAALVQGVYGSFAERPMGDLDLLVKPDRAWEAYRLLCDNGWGRLQASNDASYYEGHSHLPPLDDAAGTGIGLELHTDLFVEGNPFGLDVDEVWAAAEQVQVAGVTVLVPAPAHLMLHNCLHFAWSHLLQQGAWRAFRDVDALLGTGRMDWDAFLSLARRARATTCAYWTLRLARLMSDVPVPEPVLEDLRPPTAPVINRMLERHLAAGLMPPTARCPSVWVTDRLWEAAVRPGWSGHGSARPWQRDRAARAATPQAAAPSAAAAAADGPSDASSDASSAAPDARRRRRLAGRFAAWKRYLAGLREMPT